MQAGLHSESQLRVTVPAFYTSRLLNQLGQGLFFASLFWLASGSNGAVIGTSSLMAAMMAASILFGLPGGALADRLGPARAALAGASGRSLVILATVVLAVESGGMRVELVAGLAFAYSAISQLYSPAELALVRTVTPHRPAAAHAFLTGLQYAGQGLAIGVAAALIFIFRSPAALAVGAILFYAMVIALALVLVRYLPREPQRDPGRSAFSFAEAFRFLRHHEGAASATALLTFTEVTARALIVAVPLYLAHDLALGKAGFAVLLVPGGLGAIAGLAWTHRSFHGGIATQTLRLALLGTVVCLLALAGLGNAIATGAEWMAPSEVTRLATPATLSVAVAIPIVLLLGVCFAIGPASARAILSMGAARGQQARVFAMQGTLTSTFALIPLLLAGVGAELAGARLMFLSLAVLGCLLLVLIESRRLRRTRFIRAAANAVRP